MTDTARATGRRLGIAETVGERRQLAAEGGLGDADVAAAYRVPRLGVGQ
jgi:hypothetical protein